MTTKTAKKGWERTSITNLLRYGQKGTYYARVKVNGKEKWRSLKTKLESVAVLRLGDFQKQVRAQGLVVAEDINTGTGETHMGRFIAIYQKRLANDSSRTQATKTRLGSAVKAILKTWPDLPTRDARRITPTDCQTWASKALRVGTGFMAPKAKTVKKGMAGASFNKTVDVLREIFEIAREHGALYVNPAAEITKAPAKKKKLELPTAAQFHALVKSIAEAGARQSQDCADFVEGLAYSGTRKAEANALCWDNLNTARNCIRVPGTKTESSFRTIPLFPALKNLFARIQARRGEEPGAAPIFNVRECKGALTTACKAVGIKRITHHDLRHYFATVCIESGVDIPTVAGWLGHADGGALAMRVYGHLRQQHSSAQALKVNFGGAS